MICVFVIFVRYIVLNVIAPTLGYNIRAIAKARFPPSQQFNRLLCDNYPIKFRRTNEMAGTTIKPEDFRA